MPLFFAPASAAPDGQVRWDLPRAERFSPMYNDSVSFSPVACLGVSGGLRAMCAGRRAARWRLHSRRLRIHATPHTFSLSVLEGGTRGARERGWRALKREFCRAVEGGEALVPAFLSPLLCLLPSITTRHAARWRGTSAAHLPPVKERKKALRRTASSGAHHLQLLLMLYVRILFSTICTSCHLSAPFPPFCNAFLAARRLPSALSAWRLQSRACGLQHL